MKFFDLDFHITNIESSKLPTPCHSGLLAYRQAGIRNPELNHARLIATKMLKPAYRTGRQVQHDIIN
ncbi:MAG: hypothetical protein WCJ51_03140 [Candidatus Moraniibacteriota bacterium]